MENNTVTTSNIISDIEQKFDINLRDFQKDVLTVASAGDSDILVSVPTGHGKTFCYSFLPHLYNEIKGVENSIIIVISPLKSLMIDQVNRLQHMGITSAFVGEHQKDLSIINGVKHGKFQLVFFSPEAILGKWKSVLRNDIYVENTRAVVVDEVHCVCQWGSDFRPEYSRLSSLRAFLENSVWCCLSATITQSGLVETEKTLCLNSVKVIEVRGCRDNIQYNIEKIKRDNFSVLDWYFEELAFLKDTCPKTLIYCRSVKTVAHIYAYATGYLDGNQFNNPSQDYKSRTIAMFHRSTSQVNKDYIMQEFPKDNSTVRCVIATTAFGMGIDIPDITYVINFELPRDLESFMQQSGRAGRNGDLSKSLLYYSAQNLSTGQLDKSMIDIIQSDKCIRKLLASHFELQSPDHLYVIESAIAETCKCCTSCKMKCKCTTCDQEDSVECALDIPEPQMVNWEIEERTEIREITTQSVHMLRANLVDYATVLCENTVSDGNQLFSPEVFPELSKEAIDLLCANCAYLSSVEDIMTEISLPDEKVSLAMDILSLIEECM